MRRERSGRRIGWWLLAALGVIAVAVVVVGFAAFSGSSTTSSGPQARRHIGEVVAVSLDQGSVCIDPPHGSQVCGIPALPRGERLPAVGSTVVGYFVTAPQGPDPAFSGNGFWVRLWEER